MRGQNERKNRGQNGSSCCTLLLLLKQSEKENDKECQDQGMSESVYFLILFVMCIFILV